MGHPGFPTEPGPHWGKQWVLQTDWLSPSPAAVPTAGAASVKLAPLDLMTDHFFLAGSLGPSHLHTRSWPFRSRNRLAFSQKQNTPVLPVATLLKGGADNLGHTDPPTQAARGVASLQ